MSVSTNDLKSGMTLDLDGTLFQVIEFQHVKPGKGGAFVRTKLRNVKTGAVVEQTFNAERRSARPIVERKRDAVPLHRRAATRCSWTGHLRAAPRARGRAVGDPVSYLVEGADGAGRHARGRRDLGVELSGVASSCG